MMMTHLVTRTKLAQLVPFTHFPKFSLKTAAHHGGKMSPKRRRQVELPKELSENVIVLSCKSTAKGGVCHVYVVGTCHSSMESSKQVEDIIKFLKPETVFMELCSSRLGVLVDENMKRGNEFRSGFREASKYGAKVVLGDRPQQITLKRTWRKLPLKHIIRVFNPSYYPEINFSDSLSFSDCLSFSDLDKIGHKKIREKMYEMLPTVMETIIDERDQYMCHTLLKAASECRSVVAVVGSMHLQGIKKNWKQPIKIEDLRTIPPPKLPIPVMRIFAYVGIVAVGVTLITNTYL